MSRFGILVAGAFTACAAHASGRTYTAGDSMVPSIDAGRRVAVEPLVAPARGQIIVFRSPDGSGREYVKRIIGLPGDTISARPPEIVLNGAPIPSCRVGAARFPDADGRPRDGEVWLEALGGASWLIFHSATEVTLPSGPWTVAPGEVFVLGDSRENSHDSRFWADGKGGGLPVGLIVGVVPAETPVLPGLEPALAACRTALAR